MSNTQETDAKSIKKTADPSGKNKGNGSSPKEKPKLTGRLEVRLPPEIEIILLTLLANNTKTKSELICRLIKRCRLYNHLTDEETQVYLTLKECREGFVKLKNALNSFSEKERLQFFHNNKEYMENWIKVVDQCIDQWDRILQKLSE